VRDQEGGSSFEVGKLWEIANSKRVTRRTVLKGAAATGALAALGPIAAACGGSESDTAASPSATAPKQGGHIRSAITGGNTKDTLDGQTSYIDAGKKSEQIYEPLLSWTPDSKLQLQLAESYEISADGIEYTVRLKPDLTFHDGKSVTADDVVYSYQRVLDPKTAALATSHLTALKPSGIKKVDDLTVKFTLEQADMSFQEALAYYGCCIVPVGFETPKGTEGAIGTGPWKVTSYFPGEQTEFVANRDYYGEGPYADKLTMIEFADPTAKLNALLGGSVDHLAILDTSQVPTIESSPGYSILEVKTGGWDPFTMAMDLKPFDDVRVRQAFRLIVDRPQMIEQAHGGYSWVANDMWAVFDPGYPKDLPQRVQDLEQAKSLLKQAGYDNDLSVVLNCSTATGANDPAAAQVFAEQAKGAGVTVKVNKVDPNAYWNEGNYLSYPFAMTMWGTNSYLWLCRSALFPDGPYYETHWKDDEWEKLVLEAYQTVDDTKRNELVSQCQAIEYERGAYIQYQFHVMLDAHSDKLQGLVPDQFGAEGATKSRFNLMYFV
jgi:peptide/nickel transport system substrate-binding protein